VREKILTELREEPPHKSEPIHIKEVSAQPKENVWTHTVLEQKIDAPLSHDTRTPVAKEISETKTVVSQIVKTTPAQAKTVSQTRPPFQSPGYVASRLEGMPVKPTFGVPKSRDTAPSPTPTEELVSPKASPFPGTATRLPTKQNVDSLQNLPPLTLSQTDVSQNNTLRKIIKWIILFCIVLIGAGLAFFASTRFNIFEEPAIITPEETFVIIPKIFETDTQTALTLPEEKSLFLSDLNSKIQNAPQGISQFYPVVNSNTERHAATTEEIFSLLDTQLPNTAIRALANTMIMGSVTTSKNEPFIVLQSSRFDVLFSGLLSWEHYLQGDLSPLFGDTASSEKFTDVTIANKSVRVLKDAQGNEILLYAFIDQTTVVISTSRDALLKIVERF
jgi:hypothetical protein